MLEQSRVAAHKGRQFLLDLAQDDGGAGVSASVNEDAGVLGFSVSDGVEGKEAASASFSLLLSLKLWPANIAGFFKTALMSGRLTAAVVGSGFSAKTSGGARGTGKGTVNSGCAAREPGSADSLLLLWIYFRLADCPQVS